MKEILIIRSVSFQQLDLNLPQVEKQYPSHKISLLTHEHGIKLAQKYKNIHNIYSYSYKEGFKYGNKVVDLKDKNFDIVIIPVTNISGVGFLNVLRFSKMIKAKKRVICNIVSEFKEISDLNITFMQFRGLFSTIIALILTAIFSVFLVAFLPLKLKCLLKK